MTEWPVDLAGVTETVVTTRGPADRWNAAALGIHAGEPVTARTWGQTRTRQNFQRRGTGYVQFVIDPVVFTEAALGIQEAEKPLLAAACAWVSVTVERIGSGVEGETEWVEWTLQPVQTAVLDERVPTLDRGRAAVVEATVAASRLTVVGYDRAELESQLTQLAAIVDRCGSQRDRAALTRIPELSEWTPGPSVPVVGSDRNESF